MDGCAKFKALSSFGRSLSYTSSRFSWAPWTDSFDSSWLFNLILYGSRLTWPSKTKFKLTTLLGTKLLSSTLSSMSPSISSSTPFAMSSSPSSSLSPAMSPTASSAFGLRICPRNTGPWRSYLRISCLPCLRLIHATRNILNAEKFRTSSIGWTVRLFNHGPTKTKSQGLSFGFVHWSILKW